MIVVVHQKSLKDKDFGSVKYNEEKIEKGKGELVSAKNFPSYIDVGNKDQVKQYLKSIEPRNKKFENVHFHATISCKGREQSQEKLKEIADDFMKNLGYNEQPYIAVFHNDTKNNHVHIVSTNVNVETGKQMVHSFSKLKSQEALAKSEKNILGIDYDEKLYNILNYSCNNLSQLEKLLKHNGFDCYQKDETFFIQHNKIKIKELPTRDLHFRNENNKNVSKQITAIINKYKDISDNKVFAVTSDDRVLEWRSKLQDDLKSKFGYDIIFSHSEDKTPFGYTLIDNKNKCVFKGSDIADMKNIFIFTDEKVDKKIFNFLENSIFNNAEIKLAAKFYFEKKYNYSLPDFLLNFGRRVPYNDFLINKNIVNGYSKGSLKETIDFNTHYSTVKVGDKYVIFSERDKYIFEVSSLVSKSTAKQFDLKVNASNGNGVLPSAESDYSTNYLTEKNKELSKNDNLTQLVKEAAHINSSSEGAMSDYKKRRRRKFKR